MADSEQGLRGVFDVDRIRRLVELMKEHELSEIDLRDSEQQIRLCREAPDHGYATPPAPVPPSNPPSPTAAPPTQPPSAPADESHIALIRSPMVGTFYSKPNPDADTFVKVGDTVDPETTVCVIEAMKVFNEIPAEVRGKIVAVLVDNEEPVDFGKPLFKVDTR